MSGFGVEFYIKFIKETDGENYVSYIEKSSRGKNWKKNYIKNVKRGLNHKLLQRGRIMWVIWKICCSKREKRNKLLDKKRVSEGSKIGVGIILGYKYLDVYSEIASQKLSVKKIL